MNDIIALLSKHPISAGLDGRALARLAAIARVETYADGAFVFRENGPARDLYVICTGRVTLELNSPAGVRTIETLDGDDALGLSWAFPGGRWFFDARADEHSQVIVIDGPQLHDLCDADSVLGIEVMRYMLGEATERLQATRIRLLDVYR